MIKKTIFLSLILTIFYFNNIYSTDFILKTDNDTFFDTDQDYTGGASLLINFSPYIGIVYSYKLFTPTEKTTLVPNKGEHPYAAFEEYGINIGYDIYNILLNLGVYGAQTGENLNGEGIQNAIHTEIAKRRAESEGLDPNKVDLSSDISHGWPSQISDKTGYQVNVKLGYFYETSNFAFFLYGRSYTGTFFIQNGIGISTQIGFNVDGFSRKPKEKNSFYLNFQYEYLNVEKNNTLEGNEADYAYAVDKEDTVNNYSVGITGILGGVKIFVEVTSLGKNYKTQKDPPHRYGTIGLGYVF